MVKAERSEKEEARVKDFQVLKRPFITEKSSIVGGDGSRVVFEVARRATKTDIKQAVERIFKVEVKAVKTCNYQGKLKKVNRSVGRRSSFKKAYVQLRPGQTIDIVEGL